MIVRCLVSVFSGAFIAIEALSPCHASDLASLHLPNALRLKIEQSYPGTLVTERQFLDKECGERGRKQPGLVTADFNGDGITDYAVVLRRSTPRKDPKYGQVRDYLVVAFLGKKDGTFEDFKLAEFEQAETTVWFIALVNSKRLYDFEKNAEVELRSPALGVIRCGGGSARYYWEGNGFRNAGGT